MNTSDRIPAFLAYLLPVIGWFYVLFFQRKNELAMFHVRQSIGLFGFVAGAVAAWAVVTWVLGWIPYGILVATMLFSIVITAVIVSLVIWVVGMSYALQGRFALLPVVGGMASRLHL
jgi:uncharacterized membrane protein